jgi:hypothetical protein
VRKLLILISIFISPVLGHGANCTKNVSNTGSGTSCSVAAPCAAQYAFDSAVAGDVWCFRGGTYIVPPKNFGDTYRSFYDPAHSGTSEQPITYQAYPEETPLFNGTSGGSGDSGAYAGLFATIMGVYLQNYIVFDGFHFIADNSYLHMSMDNDQEGGASADNWQMADIPDPAI